MNQNIKNLIGTDIKIEFIAMLKEEGNKYIIIWER